MAAVSSSVVRNGSKGTSNAFAVPFYRRLCKTPVNPIRVSESPGFVSD